MNSIGRTVLAGLGGVYSMMKLPRRTYLAATLHDFQKQLVIEDIAKDPEIAKNEVLVRVGAAGVNNADLLMVRGLHHILPSLPFVPGFELAGEILAIGQEVKNFQVGDRVLALKTTSIGAFAQKCPVREDELFRIPHSLDFEMAASLPVGYGTAFLALRDVAKVKEGQTVLVLTSQGSIGMATIDLALNFFKCQVIAACDTEAKCAEVRPMGVLATCEYTDENLVKAIRKHTGGRGVDFVVDTVGGAWFDQALQCLKPGGTLMTVGFSSGQAPVVSAQTLLQLGVTISGVWFGGFAKHKPQRFHNIIEQLVGFLDEQYIAPSVSKKFTLQQGSLKEDRMTFVLRNRISPKSRSMKHWTMSTAKQRLERSCL